MSTEAITPSAIPPTPPQRIDYSQVLSGRSKAVILVGVLVSLFLAALDQTIVATALPRIVADLQGIDLLAWITTAYLLASTAMVPIYGKLSDIYGRKIVLICGIILFLAGSMLCGIAPSMMTLVIFRGVQGLGAAALTSTAFAVPADLFAPSERARYQGMFAAVFGLASVIGPYIGGLLTDTINWRWVFYVNVPLGFLALVFIILKMPRLHSGIHSAIDYLGSVLLMVTVVPLLLALTLDKTSFPWTSTLILGLFGLSAIGLVAFLLVEMRAPSPIIPLQLFRIRTFSLLIIVSLCFGATLFASILFLSLYLVNVLGVSATSAGTALIPLTFGMVLSSILSSVIVQRTGRYKIMILIGMSIVASGFWWLSTLDISTTLNAVRLRMVVVGLGMGPALPILNLVLQNAVPFEHVGIATASRQFFQQLGQVLGATIFGVLLTSSLTTAISANLEPIKAKLPPEFAAQFDTDRLRNGSGGEVSGAQPSIEQRIDQQIQQSFATQRELITKAVRDNDQTATRTLLANPRTPDQLRELLQAGGIAAMVNTQLDATKTTIAAALRSGDPTALKQLLNDARTPQQLKDRLSNLPPETLRNPQAIEAIITQITAALESQRPTLVAQATDQALSQMNTALESAEASARTQGQQLGAEIEVGIKQAFTTSVTQIYNYTLPVVLFAIIVMLFVPELPLRRSNQHTPAMSFE